MGYLNNQLGYRDEMLETRSVVKRNNWVLLDPDGLVKNRIPGYENCDLTILGSPEMGASFADYLITAHAGAKNAAIGGNGIETFMYVVEGAVSVKNADVEADLTKGGYIYSPADKPFCFENKSGEDAKLYLYRRRYVAVEGYAAHTVCANEEDLPWQEYEGMNNDRFRLRHEHACSEVRDRRFPRLCRDSLSGARHAVPLRKEHVQAG